MVVSGPRGRVGWVLTPALWIVLPTRSRWETDVFRMVMLLAHKLPNLRPAGTNLHYPILLIVFMVDRTVVVAKKGEIGILVVVSWVTCNGNVP